MINLTSPSQPPHSSLPTRPKGKTALVGSLGLLSITSATLTGCSTRAAGHAAAPTSAATVAAPAASPTLARASAATCHSNLPRHRRPGRARRRLP